ncbi:MAG: ABC transporter ATP-binding protein [Gammaproteobacteria bacterium]|nr:ABC transporter ATP-binding protein [Gammaproteobacteria bacterium]MDH5614711.1 ABC transporter ATP-binding protein [Gammaproteobacteria bacterium]
MNIALNIRNLKKVYGNGVSALKGIDLQVEQGDFFALLGPNGAGKSTTIGIITSLINKTDGQIEIFGHNLDTDSSAAKACLGLVPQEFNFNVFEPVIEVIANQAGFYGIERKEAFERAEHYLQKLGLWEKRRTTGRQLSGGMKRRLMIARALVHQPKLLILDEPTAGVDIEIRRSMWEFLREINSSGTTIILTTHYLEEAEELCRNIAIIDHGELIESTSKKELLNKLNMETFIFDLSAPIKALGLASGLSMKLIDETTMEVEIDKNNSINRVFEFLSSNGIEVLSMRNKRNRLEELFMCLVDKNKNERRSAP